MKKIYIISLIFLIIINCQYFTLQPNKEWKKEAHINIDKEITVYSAGYYYVDGGVATPSRPCYWENTKLVDDLENGDKGWLRSIKIYKDDIYAAGCYNDDLDGPNRKACYWKNKSIVNLEQNELMPSNVNSIFILNNVVYAAGYITTDPVSDDRTACYWENGKIHRLDNNASYTSEATCVIVKEDEHHKIDIYISGFIRDTTASTDYACYWENEQLNNLNISDSQALSIDVENKNIYISGYYTITSILYAFLRKNSSMNKLSDEMSGAFSTVFANNKVYTCGFLLDLVSGSYTSCYWINNDIYPHSPGAAVSIFVYGDNVYTAGTEDPNDPRACYWKDGNITRLEENYESWAWSIYVKK